MAVEILTENEATARAHARLDTGEWWVIIGGVYSLAPVVEERYYGTHSEDFESLMIPRGGVYFFCKKTRMSREQLFEILVELESPSADSFRHSARDILICNDE